METAIIISIVATIINAAIMITGFWSLYESSKQSRKQLKYSYFAGITARYGHIMEEMPEEFFAPYDEKLSLQVKRDINHFIRLYLDLCSEEYMLYINGHIDSDVWTEWEEGIEYSLKNEYVKKFLEMNKKDYDTSYSTFSAFLNKLANKSN